VEGNAPVSASAGAAPLMVSAWPGAGVVTVPAFRTACGVTKALAVTTEQTGPQPGGPGWQVWPEGQGRRQGSLTPHCESSVQPARLNLH
jgi:hypothetical protein